MLCLGRNEKALHGRARYRQSAHTQKTLQSKTKPLGSGCVFLGCSWKGKVEEQVVRQEELNFKIKLSLLLWSQIWSTLGVMAASGWKNLPVHPRGSSVPAQHWSSPGRALTQVGSLHSVHWFRNSLTLHWINNAFSELIIKEDILEKSPCRACTQVVFSGWILSKTWPDFLIKNAKCFF